MGSAAQDHQGNIAVGYNTSNEEKKPSIVYTGKLNSEPPGQFRSETELVNGTGVQTAFGFRWGDYSALNTDPSDGCSFWITNQYYSAESQNESAFGWLTKIGRFRFSECTDEVSGKFDAFVVNNETSEIISGATIKVFVNQELSSVPHIRISKPTGVIDPVWTPPGTHRVIVSAPGYLTKSYDVAVSGIPNQGTVLDARLDPTAVVLNSDLEIISEGCVANGYVEPSEDITLAVSLKNTGQKATSNLVATLLPTGGTENPGPAQNYGALPASGESVTRNFTFRASSALSCGDEMEMKFQLSDGSLQFPDLIVPLQTGTTECCIR